MQLGKTVAVFSELFCVGHWHVTLWKLFLEFLITVLVADVVHPFKDRYRMYSGNLISFLKWEVILWTTDLAQMVAGLNAVKHLPFDAFQSYLL